MNAAKDVLRLVALLAPGDTGDGVDQFAEHHLSSRTRPLPAQVKKAAALQDQARQSRTRYGCARALQALGLRICQTA